MGAVAFFELFIHYTSGVRILPQSDYVNVNRERMLILQNKY